MDVGLGQALPKPGLGPVLDRQLGQMAILGLLDELWKKAWLGGSTSGPGING